MLNMAMVHSPPRLLNASPVEVSWGSNKKKKACKIPSKCNQSAATAEAASSISCLQEMRSLRPAERRHERARARLVALGTSSEPAGVSSNTLGEPTRSHSPLAYQASICMPVVRQLCWLHSTIWPPGPTSFMQCSIFQVF